jgi:hypothetical protein
VVLAILLPIVGVCLAPLPRTLQADLLIDRIGSDLLSVIIAAALALAGEVTANQLLRMITVRPKDLPTVAATAILHQAAPDENGRGSFSPEAPLKLDAATQKPHIKTNYCFVSSEELFLFFAAANRKPAVRVDRNVPSERDVSIMRCSALLQISTSCKRNRDRASMSCVTLRNNTLCVIPITLLKA